MADGSRVNVILPPCSLLGPIMTIRKFSRSLTTIDDLIDHKTLNKQMAAFLIAAIKAKLNIVFCGSTGSGKTTLLNVLSSHIPGHERIITIEDTSELRLMQEHVVSLQAKPGNIEGKGEVTIRDLLSTLCVCDRTALLSVRCAARKFWIWCNPLLPVMPVPWPSCTRIHRRNALTG